MLPSALVLALAFAPASDDGRGGISMGEQAPARQYRAVRTIDSIRIDGRATEKTWQRAPADDRFLERQPELGATPKHRTTLRIAYDDSALYVFIEAESPGVIVRTLRRDNTGIFSDDAVFLKIDPGHDHRTAYNIAVNADGAQLDALGLEDGKSFVLQWDGVWSAETVRSKDGYTAEFRIPFAMLGIKSADERTIGFDVSRDRPADNATYDWRLIVPPRSPMAASQFGDIVGLKNIKAQRAIEYTPYFLLRSDFKKRTFTLDPRLRPLIAAGGDFRVQIGTGSYVEASVLTDFAQVEADEVQVARDRFPLFFPERRPFFINGLDVFNFGRAREAQLFFSRRVGLVDGQPVPIGAGTKVYGRAGPVNYGVLSVQTLGTPENAEAGTQEAAPENVSVGRVRVNVTDNLNVGTMLLGRHRFGVSDQDNAAGGVDAQYIGLDGRMQYYGFVAGTYVQRGPQPAVVDRDTGALISSQRDRGVEIGSSAYSSLEYNGLYVRPRAFWLWSDAHFNPVLGFYRRTGATRQEVAVDFAPRPSILGLREIVFGPRYSIETDPGYTQRLGQQAVGQVSLNWRNGSQLSYEVAHFVDSVRDPFELYLYTVEPRRYTGFRNRVRLRSPSRRSLGADASYEAVELFGGLAHQPSLQLTARIGKHFAMGGRYTHLIGHLADRDARFNFGFANANLDLVFNRNIALDNLMRVDLSPGNQRVGLQTRIRWRFLPGSDLFVVYRTDQPLGPDPFGEPPRRPFHEVTLKLSYYLRAFIAR